MKPSPEQLKVLNSMNLAYRFHDQTVIHEEAENQRGYRVVKGSKPVVICDVFDRTTNQQFYSAKGSTEPEALALALEGSINAEKPLTPAQKNDPRLAAMQARITELEAQVAKGKTSTKRDTPPA